MAREKEDVGDTSTNRPRKISERSSMDDYLGEMDSWGTSGSTTSSSTPQSIPKSKSVSSSNSKWDTSSFRSKAGKTVDKSYYKNLQSVPKVTRWSSRDENLNRVMTKKRKLYFSR